MTGFRAWREAAQDALYGPAGFFTTGTGPSAHFRTSVHASPLFATVVLRLAERHGARTVVDVGAGGGELLLALRTLEPSLALVGVDLAPRPAALPEDVGWASEVPVVSDALLVANEWLDDLPVDVVEATADGPRVVEVSVDGTERLGPPPGAEDLAWLERWWPLAEVGDRAEVGRPRDDAWQAAVGRVRQGALLAVDYGHTRPDRPPTGTLTGYRDGRQVPPVPDGTCDVTAHVAVDAVAAAGEAAGATTVELTTQAEALATLGVVPTRPERPMALADPGGYVAALAVAGQAAELTDPAGLGSFAWLLQTTG